MGHCLACLPSDLACESVHSTSNPLQVLSHPDNVRVKLAPGGRKTSDAIRLFPLNCAFTINRETEYIVMFQHASKGTVFCQDDAVRLPRGRVDLH